MYQNLQALDSDVPALSLARTSGSLSEEESSDISEESSISDTSFAQFIRHLPIKGGHIPLDTGSAAIAVKNPPDVVQQSMPRNSQQSTFQVPVPESASLKTEATVDPPEFSPPRSEEPNITPNPSLPQSSNTDQEADLLDPFPSILFIKEVIETQESNLRQLSSSRHQDHQNPSIISSSSYENPTPSSSERFVTHLSIMAPAKMPRFDRCKDYDGEMPAELWLDRLDYDFEVDGQTSPSAPTYLRAISILLAGEASRRFRANPRMKAIMGNRASATEEEKTEVVEWLKTQFPNDDIPIEEFDVTYEVANLRQGQSENLTTYYARTLTLLKRMGGKDLEKSAMSDPLIVQKDSDRYILTSITSAFVRGIFDDKLRSHALSNNVLLVPCMWKTYEISCLSQQAIKAQEKVEAEIEMRRYYERLEHYVEQHSGVPACMALAAQNEHAYVTQQNDTSGSQHIGNHSARGAPQSMPPPVPALPASSSNDGAPGNRTAVQQTTQSQYQQRSGQQQNNNRGQSSNANYNSGRNSSPSYPPIRPAKDSQNSYINGTMIWNKERDGLLCVDCGVCGHTKQQCTNPPLPYWEKAHLRSLVFPARTVAVHHAELWRSLRTQEGPDAQEGYSQPFGLNPDVMVDSDRSASAGSLRTPSTSSSNQSIPLDKFMQSRQASVSSEPESDIKSLLGAIGELTYHAEPEEENQEPDVRSFMAARTKKRVRIQTSSDDANVAPERRTGSVPQPISSKVGEKKLRQLREIVGREGLGPMDYRELAARISVPLNLLELFQLSPEVSKQFRKLSTRKNQKRKKITPFPLPNETAQAVASALIGPKLAQIAPRVHPDDKAWKIPASIRVMENGKVTTVDLPLGMSSSDQGSDIVIMTPTLQKRMRLVPTLLSSEGFSGVSYGTADGVMHQLEQFVSFELGVKGIWRKVFAFVRPSAGPRDTELGLLLGLPWLHAVDAKIGICESVLTIGGNLEGEKPVTLRGPLFAPSSHLNLVLHPNIPSKRGNENLTIKFEEQDADQDTTSNSELDSDSESDSYEGETTSEEESERLSKN